MKKKEKKVMKEEANHLQQGIKLQKTTILKMTI